MFWLKHPLFMYSSFSKLWRLTTKPSVPTVQRTSLLKSSVETAQLRLSTILPTPPITTHSRRKFVSSVPLRRLSVSRRPTPTRQCPAIVDRSPMWLRVRSQSGTATFGGGRRPLRSRTATQGTSGDVKWFLPVTGNKLFFYR